MKLDQVLYGRFSNHSRLEIVIQEIVEHMSLGFVEVFEAMSLHMIKTQQF